jgi:DAK2 domain fusion protein YloV
MIQALSEQGFEVKDNAIVACNGTGLKHLLEAGQQWLEVHINVVNSLNVFPVPDGDTGTNMVLTMRSVLKQIDDAANHEAGTIAGAAAHGALMGARGNSGVILSQFLQGLANSLAGQTAFTAQDFGRAALSGAMQAYQSVVEPVEGTILTVARVAAEAAHCRAQTDEDLLALFTDMVEQAKIAQANTPELLPVLKEAGVTDSGGQGLVYILEGGLRFLKCEPINLDPTGETMPQQRLNMDVPDEDDYGYDVQFLIQGDHLDLAAIRAEIDRLGWSTLVVGEDNLVKVHVHTTDPGRPISCGAKYGIISDVVVENMEEQAKAFRDSSPVDSSAFLAGPDRAGEVTDIATVAVVPGTGFARIFQSLGISYVLSGGQSMNPSTQELLEAINQVQANKVLILPNNSNIILAAQQAENLCDKQVKVIPTKSLPQGVAALLSFNYQADLETNAQRMLASAQQITTIEVTRAVRQTSYNGFKVTPGDMIGLVNDELMSVGASDHQVVLDLLTKVELDLYEIVTLYFGREISADQAGMLADRIKSRYPDLEVEVHNGGQPHYHYIISLE